MADVTILNVPDGAEEDVKEMALIAIERFMRSRDLKVAEEVEMQFKTDIDSIREANSLKAKFKIAEPVKEELSKEDILQTEEEQIKP